MFEDYLSALELLEGGKQTTQGKDFKEVVLNCERKKHAFLPFQTKAKTRILHFLGLPVNPLKVARENFHPLGLESYKLLGIANPKANPTWVAGMTDTTTVPAIPRPNPLATLGAWPDSSASRETSTTPFRTTPQRAVARRVTAPPRRQAQAELPLPDSWTLLRATTTVRT